MPLNPSLLLIEILIVNWPDSTDFLRLLGLSLVPILDFAATGSKMVEWSNGVASGDLPFLYFLETLCNKAERWKTVKLNISHH